MQANPQETTELITYTDGILDGRLYFLCSAFSNLVTEKVGQCFDDFFIPLNGFYHFFNQSTKNVHTLCIISITKEFLIIQWVNALSK